MVQMMEIPYFFRGVFATFVAYICTIPARTGPRPPQQTQLRIAQIIEMPGFFSAVGTRHTFHHDGVRMRPVIREISHENPSEKIRISIVCSIQPVELHFQIGVCGALRSCISLRTKRCASFRPMKRARRTHDIAQTMSHKRATESHKATIYTSCTMVSSPT